MLEYTVQCGIWAELCAVLTAAAPAPAPPPQVQKALIDMENMFELLHTAPLVADEPGARRLVVIEGAVRFDDITFGYSPLRPVLRNVNFEVPGEQCGDWECGAGCVPARSAQVCARL